MMSAVAVSSASQVIPPDQLSLKSRGNLVTFGSEVSNQRCLPRRGAELQRR